jgi:ribosome-binding factor A
MDKSVNRRAVARDNDIPYVILMPGNAPSQRMLRAGELIRHALAEVIQRGDVGDPEVDRLAPTISEVQVSPDLKIATAFVRSLLIGKEQQALDVLNKHRKYIRGLLAPKLEMKFMPEIRFKVDTSLDYANKIDDLLHKPEVQRDLEKK